MTPCGPVPFLGVEIRSAGFRGRHLFLPTVSASGDMRYLLGFHMFGTTDELDLNEEDTIRLICHALIHRLPDQGLTEAVESLTGLYEFYTAPVEPPKPLLPHSRVKGRITGSHVRPVFPVTEED